GVEVTTKNGNLGVGTRWAADQKWPSSAVARYLFYRNAVQIRTRQVCGDPAETRDRFRGATGPVERSGSVGGPGTSQPRVPVSDHRSHSADYVDCNGDLLP